MTEVSLPLVACTSRRCCKRVWRCTFLQRTPGTSYVESVPLVLVTTSAPVHLCLLFAFLASTCPSRNPTGERIHFDRNRPWRNDSDSLLDRSEQPPQFAGGCCRVAVGMRWTSLLHHGWHVLKCSDHQATEPSLWRIRRKFPWCETFRANHPSSRATWCTTLLQTLDEGRCNL